MLFRRTLSALLVFLLAAAPPAFAQVAQALSARPMQAVDVINALHFPPVQQGTGINQGPNAIKLGWSLDGTKLKATVDATDLGAIALESWASSLFRVANAPPEPSRITRQKTVFVGSVTSGFATLTDPVSHAQLLAEPRIGLYEHGNGMAGLTPAQRSTLWQVWGPTGITPTGGGQAIAEIGEFAPIDPGYLVYFGGAYPSEANLNVTVSGSYTAGSGDAKPQTVYGGYVSATDLASMQTAITAANAAGALNVAPFLTPNQGSEDLDDPFATAPFWAPTRTAILFGGGLALDVPPSYWQARGGSTSPYAAMLVQMIRWTQSRGDRVSMTVSPYAVTADASGHSGAGGYDPSFLTNTQDLENFLAGAGAAPGQWVVENYSLNGSENDIAPDGTANSINDVALWLAHHAAPAMQGTTPAGSSGVADQGLLATALSAVEIASDLGFMPVQQGTGAGQLANAIKIGWSGSKVKLTVDATDMGAVALESWVTANFAPIGAGSGGGAVASVNGRTGAVTLDATDITGGLSYTPVQQGTGSGQLSNVVKIGWTGSTLTAQVDATNLGALATQPWVTATLAGSIPSLSSPLVTAGTINVYGTAGNPNFAAALGAIGYNASGSHGEIAMSNNADPALPSAFEWYRKRSDGSEALIMDLSTNGTLEMYGGLTISGDFQLPTLQPCSTETRSRYACLNGRAVEMNP